MNKEVIGGFIIIFIGIFILLYMSFSRFFNDSWGGVKPNIIDIIALIILGIPVSLVWIIIKLFHIMALPNKF